MISEDALSKLIQIGHMARRLQLFSLSERMFEHLHHAYPGRAFPHVGLGLVFAKTDRHERACRELEQAIDIDAGDKDVYFWHGMCAFACDRYLDAVKSFRKTIEMDERDGDCELADLARRVLEDPNLVPIWRNERHQVSGDTTS